MLFQGLSLIFIKIVVKLAMTFSFMVAPKTAVCFYLSHETGQAEIIQNLSAYFSLWEQYIQMSLAGKPQQSLQVDKNVLSPLFFNSQCIDSNGRTFILVSKQCPILNNSMLSLPTFHFIRRQIARQKPKDFSGTIQIFTLRPI